MKKILILSIIIVLSIFGYSLYKPSLELTNSSVNIIKEEEKTGAIVLTEGDKKGQKLIPTALYYEFTVKNVGFRKIGNLPNKGLKAKIEPSDNLKAISQDIIGINIFDKDSYVGSGVGTGSTAITMLKPGEEGKFTLHYDLGVSEETREVPLRTPTEEKSKELKDNALDASLIVMLEDKEVARFKLNK